mgnify:CR=1 FL=1
MSNEMMKREMQEAVQAGERALQSLYAARDKLGSARNWGIFDMLGGGFISDFVKHSKMNDAAALMEQAKSDIQRFQRELRDGAGFPWICAWKSAASFPLRISFWTGWWQIIWCRARLQMQENRWMMPSTG